jgi:hypothetical protein
MPAQFLPRASAQQHTKTSGIRGVAVARVHLARPRSIVLTIAAIFFACVLSACGTVDRKADADQLQRAIKTMPGVVDARVDYTNDSERGATLKVSVHMPDAPPQQIADVAARINKVRGDAFNAFDQTAEFSVTPSRQVRVTRGADLDPAGIAADAEHIRRFSEAVDAAQVSISGRQLSTPAGLRVDEVKTPADDVFAAVRAAFGNDAQLSLDMLPAANVKMPLWSVSFPLSAEEEQRVDQQMAAMPVSIWSITVGPQAAIVNLNVALHTPDTAYQDLVSVIDTTEAEGAHPLDLGWRMESQSAFETLQFKGTVDADGCAYAHTQGEMHPEFYLTPDALEVQQRLRAQFDKCPK